MELYYFSAFAKNASRSGGGSGPPAYADGHVVDDFAEDDFEDDQVTVVLDTGSAPDMCVLIYHACTRSAPDACVLVYEYRLLPPEPAPVLEKFLSIFIVIPI